MATKQPGRIAKATTAIGTNPEWNSFHPSSIDLGKMILRVSAADASSAVTADALPEGEHLFQQSVNFAVPTFANPTDLFQDPDNPEQFVQLADLVRRYPNWGTHVSGVILANNKTGARGYTYGAPSMAISYYYYQPKDETRWVFHERSAIADFRAVSQKNPKSFFNGMSEPNNSGSVRR